MEKGGPDAGGVPATRPVAAPAAAPVAHAAAPPSSRGVAPVAPAAAPVVPAVAPVAAAAAPVAHAAAAPSSRGVAPVAPAAAPIAAADAPVAHAALPAAASVAHAAAPSAAAAASAAPAVAPPVAPRGARAVAPSVARGRAAGLAADVVVAGAGVYGLAAALACARRGMSVLVVEAATPGAGASGGPVGALAPHAPHPWTPAKAAQARALAEAAGYWAGVAAEGGVDPGYARLGRATPLTSAAARARAEAAAAAAGEWPEDAALEALRPEPNRPEPNRPESNRTEPNRPDAARPQTARPDPVGRPPAWTVLEPDRFPGWLAPEAAPFGVAFDTLSARLTPPCAVAALAAALVACGGRIRPGWRVTEVEDGALRSGADRIAAGVVVIATGAAAEVPGLRVGAAPGQAALLGAAPPAGAPLIAADGLWIVPQPGGVAVGSTADPPGPPPASSLDAVIARARALCPALAGAPVLARWAGLRPRAARPDPLLARLSSRTLVATGGFRTGLATAPTAGALVAAMAAGETPELPRGWSLAEHLETATKSR